MFIAESIIAMTVLCSAPKRQRWDELHKMSNGAGAVNCFQITSGISLERKVTIELEEIAGVRDVKIQRSGNSFSVDVIVADLDFSTYEQVIKKEIELFDRFPELSFEFNVMPASSLEITPTVLYAA
jgi:hypothetical protein